MIGLGVFFVAAIWFAISFSVMFFSTMKIKKIMWRLLLICIFWPLIFLAPMADVIIGLHQFDQVCKEKGWVYDEHEVRNSTVKYGGQTVQRIDDKFIPIEKITTYWVDPVKLIRLWS